MPPKKVRRGRDDQQQQHQPPNSAITEVKSGKWFVQDNFWFRAWNHRVSADVPATVQVAGFDLDDTVITSKTGAAFPDNAKDWKFVNEHVLPQLQNLVLKGKKILVFFSNQSSLCSSSLTNDQARVRQDMFKDKLDMVQQQLQVPMFLICATVKDSKFFKPQTSMWPVVETLLRRLNVLKQNIDVAGSFFCGDAAGRSFLGQSSVSPLVSREKDHSDCDKMFAEKLKLKFFTPEEYFVGDVQDPTEAQLRQPQQTVVGAAQWTQMPVLAGPTTEYGDDDKSYVAIRHRHGLQPARNYLEEGETIPVPNRESINRSYRELEVDIAAANYRSYESLRWRLKCLKITNRR